MYAFQINTLLFFIVWASCNNPLLGWTKSQGRCWAIIQLSHHPEPSGCAVHGDVDGLDIRGHGRRFVLLHYTQGCRGGHILFVQAGVETSNIGAEADKPCSWKGLSRSVGADVGDESTESRSVVQQLRIPSVISLEHHTFLLLSDELMSCCVASTNGRLHLR